MQIVLNDKVKVIDDHSSVSLMLNQIQLEPKGIAIAINETVVPKQSWDQHLINENDKVLIIKATQGG